MSIIANVRAFFARMAIRRKIKQLERDKRSLLNARETHLDFNEERSKPYEFRSIYWGRSWTIFSYNQATETIVTIEKVLKELDQPAAMSLAA